MEGADVQTEVNSLADGYSREDSTFDWEQMKRWMGQGGTPQPDQVLSQSDWVQRYVGKLLGASLAGLQPNLPGGGEPELFETHRFIIAKLKIPAGVRDDQLRLLVRPDRIKLMTGGGREDRIVRLPCLVVPSTCRALLAAGILQVKLRKRRSGDQYEEAVIRKSPDE
ncbi:Hsp20/alpha crystallin family protein [Paenibacillus sp. 598K]|uniref:Hsp20/alpha crystallin family protein n=1 Tax=Paenibacillus sp. 598K TaxID=1117987 RepID=UPI000FFE869F|nr:Hsp20/alpha crystallin family protein [Paenibacillus sp. 598K]